MRKCDSTECENDAGFTFVWTEGWVFHCFECTQKLLAIAQELGYAVPQSTARRMTIQEAFEDEVENG